MRLAEDMSIESVTEGTPLKAALRARNSAASRNSFSTTARSACRRRSSRSGSVCRRTRCRSPRARRARRRT